MSGWPTEEKFQGVRGVPPARLLVETDVSSGWPWRNDPRPYRADVPPCGGGLRGGSPALVERVRENFQSLFG